MNREDGQKTKKQKNKNKCTTQITYHMFYTIYLLQLMNQSRSVLKMGLNPFYLPLFFMIR